jgi:lysophospholipase L1-like esterase
VIIVLVLLAAGVALIGLPAVRCAVFGASCRGEVSPSGEGPAGDRHRLSPVEVATRGRYVALGDSYSAGGDATATDREVGNRCRRTSQSYVHEVMRDLRFARGAEFWACSGATTSSVLSGGSGEPPQVDRVGATTSLMTISIGGNDVGFSRVLARCVAGRARNGDCQGQGPEIATRMDALRPSLTRVIDQITARAPYARVIVLGYPRLFPETGRGGPDDLSVGDQRWLNARARELNELIRQVTRDADERIAVGRGKGSVEFVDVYSGFAGHEIGSADPYVHGLTVDVGAMRVEAQSFHPTAAGQRRLADLVIRQIYTGPGRPLDQYR